MSCTVKVRRSVSYSILHGDREFQVEHEPDDSVDPIIRELDDGRIVVGYLSRDDDPPDPFDGDGMGQIYDRRNMSQEKRNEMHDLLGWGEYGELFAGRKRNPYSVPLDVYSHGGDSWSLAGEGYECRWDTSHNAGIWLPDPCCVEHIEYTAAERLLPKGTHVAYEQRGKKINVITYTLPDGTKKGGYKNFVTAIRAAAKALGITLDKDAFAKKSHEIAVECAKQAVEEYQKYIDGEAFGVCVEVFDTEGECVDEGSCWGYLGREYAEEELESQVNCVK